VLSINSNDEATLECWHGFGATCAVVSADDGVGLGYRHQMIVIEFLQAENRLLKERLRGKRFLPGALHLGLANIRHVRRGF
jgi:hypothetical protein